MNSGRLVILSGPSGVGKGTIAEALCECLGARFSVSMTTREQRANEIDGEDYHFVSETEFKRLVMLNQVLEYAQVYGRFYGTPREPIEQALADGEVILLDIDIQGAVQVKRAMPEALAIYVKPPSAEALLQRLRDRGRESEEEIQSRFTKLAAELLEAEQCGAYDHVVVNDNLEDAIVEVIELITGDESDVS